MTAPTVRHRDVGDKYNTGVPKITKIGGRENISVGTWHVRTLRPAGKLKQLTQWAMGRDIVGLCEMRWKNFCEMSTDDRLIHYLLRLIYVEKRTDMSMGLDLLCIGP